MRPGAGLVAAAVLTTLAPLGGAPHPARAAAPQVVTVYADHYVPATVTVERGGTLQFLDLDPWGNGEAPGHSLTERRLPGPRFDSGVVGLGRAAEVGGVAALTPGSYGFTCRIHPFMSGTLVIR